MNASAETLAAMRFERTPQSPERALFMQRLSEHEDVLIEMIVQGASGERVEQLRMSRRAVMAAFDQVSR